MLCGHGIHYILTAITWTLKFISPMHPCCSSSQNTFALLFLGTLLLTPSELREKENGEMLESQIQEEYNEYKKGTMTS